MILKPFSPKVNKRMLCHDHLQFYEGPVRSGKTLSSVLSLMMYIETHNVKFGLMSGYSSASLYTNVIGGNDASILSIMGADCEYKRINDRQALIVRTSHGPVTIWCVGAGDVRSQAAIQGMTAEFWYADEITRHHMSFISEAFARLAVADDPCAIWTANPDNPYNPIYKTYTDRYLHMPEAQKKAFGGYHEFHFTMWDNPVMTEKKFNVFLETYPPGFERDRKIYGKRCIAEGLVYPIDRGAVFKEKDPSKYEICYVGIDFGIIHPTCIHLGGYNKDDIYDWHIFYEWETPRIDGTDERVRLDTDDIFYAFEELCASHELNPYSMQVAIDPGGGGAALISTFRARGITTVEARKGDLAARLAYTNRLMNSGMMTISPECIGLEEEMGSYSWNPVSAKTGHDEPIKFHDDHCDSMGYLTETWIHPMIGDYTRDIE